MTLPFRRLGARNSHNYQKSGRAVRVFFSGPDYGDFNAVPTKSGRLYLDASASPGRILPLTCQQRYFSIPGELGTGPQLREQLAGPYAPQTQATVLQGKNCNVFVEYDNDTSIIEYGICCGGAYIDETFGDNAFQNAMQTAVYNANYTTATKVPQTDSGSNTYSNAISGVCQQFVTNGFGAPGQWNADGFGSLQTGQFLKLGYYIYAPPISSQSETARQNRQSVPFQVAFKLAGATQTAQINVAVNQ